MAEFLTGFHKATSFGSGLFGELLNRATTPLDDPGSRLFYLNILASVMIALIYFSLAAGKLKSPRGWRNRMGLRWRFWWNRSAKIDYQLLALNSVLKVVLFIPLLSFGYEISQATIAGLLKVFGDFQSVSPTALLLALFTLAVFVWDDFLRFLHHLLMHRVSWLWLFHMAHHSARVLTPMTLYRTHPVEALLATLRNGLSLGVATGVFLFIFDGHFHVLTFFGVNLFGQLFNLLGSNLRHSHVPLGFGVFERIFISPAQHQIHHSRAAEDFDRNFGVSLAIWDQLAGSLVLSRERRSKLAAGQLRYGVAGAYSGQLVPVVVRPILIILSTGFQMLSNTSKRWTHWWRSRKLRELGQIGPEVLTPLGKYESYEN
jgi:sterol desaturase/sphingolipid hydroxylase (fatty acid hydroxylase superfamily)